MAKTKSIRLTSRQGHILRKEKAELREKKNRALKIATLQYQEAKKKEDVAKAKGVMYSKVSAKKIAEDVETDTGVQISERTIRRYVQSGMAGATPEKPGEKGSIPPRAYKALCGAFETYVKLSALDGTSQLTIKLLAERLNSCVNKMTNEDQKHRHLYDRVLDDLGQTLDIGKPNRVEQRRSKWTTYTNVRIWFDSLKHFLVEEGFAEPTPAGIGGAELIFYPQQTHRIVNLDESGMILDNTKPGSGGRPPLNFYDPLTQEAPVIAAHKNSYCLTGLFGSTMSGHALPLHLVLPSDATAANMNVPPAFVQNFKDIIFDPWSDGETQHGTDDDSATITKVCKSRFPVSMAMNEKDQ